MRIDHYLLGYCEVSIPVSQAAAFFNVCREGGLVYQPCDSRFSDWMPLRCRRRAAKRILAACKERGIDARITGYGGLPYRLLNYRKRYGLMVGMLLSAFVIWAGSNVVWDVRIEGEGEMYLPAIRQQMEESGLFVGGWIPALDTDRVEQTLLTDAKGIAWVSVNLKGTVAYVQVRPLLSPKETDASGQPANLVAAEDGVVESVRLMSGDVKVKPGDIVRKGQLLIGGVRETTDLGYALTQARGEVMARVQHTLTVEIPLTQEKKVYSEQKTEQKSIFFFGKEIKITKSTGIGGGNCDTIRRMETFSLFGGEALPLSLQTIEYCPYEIRYVTISPEEAQRLAYEELGAKLTLATRDATLLSQSVVCEMTSECCRLICQYWCVQNIATPLPFSVGGGTFPK